MPDTQSTPPPIPRDATPARPDYFYVLLGGLALLLASLPYLYGYFTTPAGYVYTGLTYNIDDGAVYLSWMRQAASGHFFIHNQFTTEPQRGVLFNLFFLLLGGLVRLTHLPPIAVYQAARVVCGGLLLGAVAGLIHDTLADTRARRAAFALVCFSSGLGWMWGTVGPESRSIDLWQPEAITFLSLYFAPLFVAALSLMVVFLRAALRFERSGVLRDIWPAAVTGALLGNFHSYDVIHLFAVWGVFRIVSDAARRRLDLARWRGIVLAGLATLPTTAYQYYALRVEPVFFERAFVSATWSPAVYWVLAGYGLVLALAAVCAFLPATRRTFADNRAFVFLAVWAVTGIAVAYVPVAFQRKLLMGEHIPLCLLGGAALASLPARLSGDFPKIAVFFAVLLAAPSNGLFLLRDMTRLSQNEGSTARQPYLKQTEWDALEWLRANTRPDEVVLVSPDAASHRRFPFAALEPFLSVYVPALAGNVVYDGHWSETARYGPKLASARRFFEADTPDNFRKTLLENGTIRYILWDNRLSSGPPALADGTPLPAGPNGGPYAPVAWSSRPATLPVYLQPAYQNTDVTVYRVHLP